jgi:ligand-binding sensor domain-containing protein
MLHSKPQVVFPFVLALVIMSSCAPTMSESPPPTVISIPTQTLSAGPGQKPDLPEPPSPTATFADQEIPSTAPDYATGVASATTVATSPAPGWTDYESINNVHALAFAPDGTLWAATPGGLVHWNLDASTYIRYQIQARDVVAAPDGTLWLALEHGVCHFDGAACEIYTETDGLLHSMVHTVAVAPDGVVWVGTGRGVSRFDGTSWRDYPSDVPTTDLAIAANGEIWAATTGGVGRYLPVQDAWMNYAEEHGLPTFNAQNVAAGPEGEVWAYFLWDGIYRFDGESWQKVDGITGLVADVAFSADGTPWVVTTSQHYPAGSLAYRHSDTWIDVSGTHGSDFSGIIATGPTGEIAAATWLGVAVREDGGWRLLRDGPTSDRVSTVAVTSDGAAWFGFGDHSTSTPGWGVSRFDGDEWQYFLDNAEVNVLAVAPDGSLWAGVGCSVQRFDGHTWETVGRCQEGLPFGNIIDMDFTPDGAVWVASGLGLARFDGQTWSTFEKLANSVIASPDSAVWINGWEGSQNSYYVARFDGETWTAYNLADAYPDTFRASAVTPDGRVWDTAPGRRLVSFDGQSWTDRESWAYYPLPDDLSSDRVHIVDITSDGALWIRGGNGVARFDPSVEPDEAWTLYVTDSGLLNNYANATAFGPNGEIWFGATRFQPTEEAPSAP